MRLRRWFKIALAIGGLGLVAMATPVAWVEVACVNRAPQVRSDYRPILDAPHRRAEINTYLTYPEWYIVHAYEDLAGVLRTGAESQFGYFSSIRGYWRNLCRMTDHASARESIAGEVKTMLYIIGVSFAVELGIKGLYEHTVGRFTEWLRGDAPTPEDRFALAVAENYALFLRQTPWYEYPFGATLRRFWTEVPWGEGNVVRKIERRLSLSLEYGVKALYARAIGALASLAPAALRIRSVVRGLDETDMAADRRIQRIEVRADGTSIIETPRYREFTEILVALAARGRDVVEIAGNDDIFVTVLMPSGAAPVRGERLVTVPIQSAPGLRRDGVAIRVAGLADLLRELSTSGVRLEHIYDY